MKITFYNVVGTIDVYMDVLRAICGETEGKSLIDLGCCFAPNTPKLGFEQRLYIDIYDRKLDDPKEQPFFQQYNVLDIDNLVIKKDVAIASDFIEHLYHKDGKEFVEMMKRISHKQIIFTPLGEIFKLHNTGPDDPEAHHSLWTPDDFPGWATIVFPDYHKEWNGGAFWAFKSENLQEDYNRVWCELMSKKWTNEIRITVG